MSLRRKLAQQRTRRMLRVRSAIKSSGLMRVSIFRSTKHIYGQLIDDASGATLVSCSTLQLKNISGDKKKIAYEIGLELAKRCISKGYKEAVFDRGPFLYHGRVKSLAEGLRAGGLVI